MKIIVGLGNPGSKYEKTLHNMGFLTLGTLGKRFGLNFRTSECRARTDVLRLPGAGGELEKVLFALPQTYMNLSGDSVFELVGKYKLALSDLLVVYDDLDLEKGVLRFRAAGSPGTHNGMRSICTRLGETGFPRLRIGIGRPPHPDFEVADYVLSEVRKGDYELMGQAIERAADACEDFFRGMTAEQLMQKYNARG